MFFSRPCQHAVRALVHLAMHQGEMLCTVQEIAKAEELPAPALAAVLQNLVRGGLVRSQKGPGGGFSLARPPAELTLYDIMETVDTRWELFTCAIGLEECSDETPCPVHDRLQEVRQQLVVYLHSVTVADMAMTLTQKHSRRRTPQDGSS
jgi:Rrf2 family transcriptional regulator, iron-sulfur cluster assembly transcription factor